MLVSYHEKLSRLSLTMEDNPSVQWEKVTCPEALSFVSGCRRNDDPVPGKNTPTPTKSAPIASGTVSLGGQCGGRNYRGPTVCVKGTVCTFVDENTYYCLPDPANTRTTPIATSATAQPTIALPWDQCGGKCFEFPSSMCLHSYKVGRGWTGPTRCKDSECVRYDDYWSQCQPASNIPPSSTNRPAQPTWTFTRPPIVFPGPSTSTSVRKPTPTGFGQLYDQCGGKTWEGVTRCAPGLICAFQNDYFSICQKPAHKKSEKVSVQKNNEKKKL